jgi:hypothetical protein
LQYELERWRSGDWWDIIYRMCGFQILEMSVRSGRRWVVRSKWDLVFPTKILSPMVRGGYQQLFFLFVLSWLLVIYLALLALHRLFSLCNAMAAQVQATITPWWFNHRSKEVVHVYGIAYSLCSPHALSFVKQSYRYLQRTVSSKYSVTCHIAQRNTLCIQQVFSSPSLGGHSLDYYTFTRKLTQDMRWWFHTQARSQAFRSAPCF